MQIQRNQSRLSFRKQRRRRSGCLPLAVLVGLVVGAVTLSWNWIGQRLQINAAQQSGDGLLAEANAAFSRGDLDSAISLARQVLEGTPNQPDAVALLARALVYRSYADYDRAVDRRSALEVTTGALQADPNNPTLLAIHAYTLQAAGQPTDAARIARQALDQDETDGLARVSLALAYGGVGSFEVALRESLEAAKDEEWQMEAQRALAISYSDLGDYPSAIRAVEQALKLNNRLIPLYFEQALYALQVGDGSQPHMGAGPPPKDENS